MQAPLQAIDAHDGSEPRLLIPQPQGWTRNTTLDSDIIRYVLADQSLAANSFTPTVVVTLEHLPGTDITPQTVLDQQRSVLERQAGATDLTVTPTTICGSTAETIRYTAAPQGAVPARPATVLIVTAPYGNDVWLATATTQTTNADDPTYQQDTNTILTGFKMLPPPS